MIVSLVLVSLHLVSLAGQAAEASPAARVEAQRDIERARDAFVIGNSKPFDELYPRSVFEAAQTPRHVVVSPIERVRRKQ